MNPKYKISKTFMSVKLLLVQNWGKMAHFPQSPTGTLLEISYIPLLAVMRLRYHRLYQILSLEDNLCLEDMKQLFGQKSGYTYTSQGIPTPKLISLIYSNNDKKYTILNIPSYCPGLKYL